MPIIAPSPSPRRSRTSDGNAAQLAWPTMAWVGGAFVIMGLTDIALGWYPASFGNAEWEFGAISATLNGFALPTLGLYLMLAGAIAAQRTLLARILSGLFVLLCLAIGILGVIYLTVIPLALASVAANELLTAGMRKAVIKAAMLFAAYLVLFAAAAFRGWRVGRPVQT
jgi:hypothetical protein